MPHLFGTDGVRGIANSELTCEQAMAIGRASAIVLTDDDHLRPHFIIGKDTRISSDMLESALVAGLCSVGADVTVLGVIPTPAVAYLVQKYKADAGIMISASHNPCEYNGIKIFNSQGYKLSDELEDQVENIVLGKSQKQIPVPTGAGVGKVSHSTTAIDDYVNYLMGIAVEEGNAYGGILRGMKIAIDCANGAAYKTAKKLFPALGARCVFINDQPDGTNINQNCGSTHMKGLSELVKELNLFGGVAFDGDADRCLIVDENGDLIDGDKIITMLAIDMKEKGKLKKDTAVVTVMSNLGLFHSFEENNLKAITTNVGDRYVLEEMCASGYNLGGEQSGHVILGDHATTGDGQLCAIKLLTLCRQQGKKLSNGAMVMQRFPQVMLGIKANSQQKIAYLADKKIEKIIKSADDKLGNDGRILIRPSGTEPLIRIMVEGKDFDSINETAVQLAETIKASIYV